jgi:hypothetical protein
MERELASLDSLRKDHLAAMTQQRTEQGRLSHAAEVRCVCAVLCVCARARCAVQKFCFISEVF